MVLFSGRIMLTTILEVCSKEKVENWRKLTGIQQGFLAEVTRIAGYNSPDEWTTQNLPNVAKTFANAFSINRVQDKQIFNRAISCFLVVRLFGR